MELKKFIIRLSVIGSQLSVFCHWSLSVVEMTNDKGYISTSFWLKYCKDLIQPYKVLHQ